MQCIVWIDAPSYTSVTSRAVELKHGRESLEDDPSPGRPATATTPEIIRKTYWMKIGKLNETYLKVDI